LPDSRTRRVGSRLQDGLSNRLDKTIASFANTYGGHILIGVDETPTGEPLLPIVGVALQPGLRERVVATALQAIDPPVYPEVRVVEFQSPGATSADRAVVIVRVHESDVSAHAIDGGTSVYLRVDNISNHCTRKATVEEIAWLINKRQRSLDLKERLLREAQRRAGNYVITYRTRKRLSTEEPKGMYELWTVPKFPRTAMASPQRLLELSRSQLWKQQVGNFEFPKGSALPIPDRIRQPDSPGLDYWYTEANRFGLLYTQVGFPQASPEYKDAIGCPLVAKLLMTSLRFSLALYDMLGYFGLIDFHFTTKPTRDRYPHVWEGESYFENRSLDDAIALEFSGSVKEIRESLAARVKQSYQEFLWAFGLKVDDAAASNHFKLFGIA
jgi:schlafen family protein